MSVSEEKKNIYDDLIAAGAPNTYGEAIKELVTTYNNSKFSYDPVTDKAFQDYAKMMREQGSKAAEDTMGKAASMTGGFGNSYATTAAQGVQNQYMETIDAKAEDFYNRALANFNSKQNQLLTTISLMAGLDDAERANWESDVSKAYAEYADALSLENQKKTEEFELAMTKAQYGDAADLEALLGMEPGTIQKYLQEQAITEAASDLKTPTAEIRQEALASLMRKGVVEQGLDAAVEDVASRYITLGYSDMSEWLMDEFDNAEYVFDRTWTKTNKKSGKDAEYTDQFGNVFKKDELENWADGQYRAMYPEKTNTEIKGLVKDFIKGL